MLHIVSKRSFVPVIIPLFQSHIFFVCTKGELTFTGTPKRRFRALAPYQHPFTYFLPSPGNPVCFMFCQEARSLIYSINFYYLQRLQGYILQLTADITITITGGIIHIQIERRAITAIIPFTA